MKKKDKQLYQIYQNMIAGKYHIKGKNDSNSRFQVLASKESNYFGPDVCYFSFIEDLKDGIYYITSENE